MPDLTQRFTGHLMLFDHEQRVTLSAGARLWVGPASCGFDLADGHGGEWRRLVFEQRQIVWAMTCMVRLLRRQAYRVETVAPVSKRRARRRLTRICGECAGAGETYVDDCLVTCPLCHGKRTVRS